MDNCGHVWLYIGSERQMVWRCTLCDEYRLTGSEQNREWVGLEDDEESQAIWLKVMADTKNKRYLPVFEFARAIEAKLKEKNK